MKVILAGPDENSLTRSAYPAFSAAGFQVMAVVDTPEKLRDIAAALPGSLAVVEAGIAFTPDEAWTLLAGLEDVRLVLILPAMWASLQERFTRLPGLVAGFAASIPWPNVAAELVRRLAGRTEETVFHDEESMPRRDGPRPGVPDRSAEADRQSDAPAASRDTLAAGGDRSGLRPTLRLAFHGVRGGAGTSTAALEAARALASAGRRVALFDATGRGDLHLMAGIKPVEQPVARGGITFLLCPPTEEAVWGFDAVVVDGGRERGDFNAEWVAVSRPFPAERISRLIGVELQRAGGEESGQNRSSPGREAGEEPSRPRRGLGGLISVEWTD